MMVERSILPNYSSKAGAEILLRRLREFYRLKGHRDVRFWLEPLILGGTYTWCIRSNIRLVR